MGTQGIQSVAEVMREHRADLPISTLLVSSNTLILKGITGMLKNVRNVNLLGNAPGRIDMMLMIDDLNPSLVIINDDEAGSKPPSILETVRLARHEYPNLNILVLLNNQDFYKELSALRLGIRGILSEDFNKKKLTDCIKHIISGGLWLRRSVMEKFIAENLSFHNEIYEVNEGESLSSFTRRELQIIRLASRGLKNREIAQELYISEKTVKHHMSRIFKKLKIQKRTQLKGFL